MCLFRKQRKSIQVSFGVPYFDIYDTQFSEFSVPVSVRGFITLVVKNYKKFQKQNDKQEFCTRVKNAASAYVKESITELLLESKIPVLHLEKKLVFVADFLSESLATRLKREFKIILSSVDITAIEIDKTSFGYSQLKALTQDITSATVQAQAELRIQQMRDKQRIETEKYEKEMLFSPVKEKQKGVFSISAFIISLLALGCAIFGLIF